MFLFLFQHAMNSASWGAMPLCKSTEFKVQTKLISADRHLLWGFLSCEEPLIVNLRSKIPAEEGIYNNSEI